MGKKKNVKKPLKGRKEALLDLIKNEMVSDQNEIVELLKDQYGIETNQAAISRDVRSLGVIKKKVGNDLIYELPTTSSADELLKLAITDIVYNETMIVLKTRPGLANFVGDCLDQYHDIGILGCLAGENVVFAIPQSIKKIKECYKNVCNAMNFKKFKDDYE